MWEEGLAQSGSKCNIEFKMHRGGGQQNWIVVVGTPKNVQVPPQYTFENGIALINFVLSRTFLCTLCTGIGALSHSPRKL